MSTPWFEAFVRDGDLERADVLLAQESGWFETGLRARVASLALQQENARRFFDASLARWQEEEPHSPIDILRLSLIDAFELDDQILWGQGTDTFEPRPNFGAVEDLHPAFGKLPLISGATYARALLAQGKDREALDAYRDLLGRAGVLPQARSGIGASDQALWRCACACALANLGDEEEALVEVEKAGLGACAAKYPIYQGLLAARIASICDGLRRRAEGGEWRAMLRRLDLPDRTKEVFERRGEIMTERSMQAKCLLLF